MDVIQVATLHLHMCYVIVTTVVYGLSLSISTLWNLFQGIVGFCIERVCSLCFDQGSATTSCVIGMISGFMKWMTLFLAQSFLL